MDIPRTEATERTELSSSRAAENLKVVQSGLHVQAEVCNYTDV